MKEGQGTILFSNGASFTGEFRDGFSHGKGTFNFPNGDCLQGNWKEDLLQGKGTMIISKPGMVIEGDFHEESETKRVKVQWKNGAFFEGEFKDGRPEGQGKYDHPLEGVLYKGSWKNGRAHGKGELLLEGNMKVTGEWLEGFPHGEISIKHVNFEIVCGFEKGQIRENEQGVINFPEKFKYSGGLSRNLNFHGKGTLSQEDIIVFGKWEDGKENGSFKVLFRTGDTIEGHMEDGEFRGQCEI